MAVALHEGQYKSTVPPRLPPWLTPPDVARPLLPHKDIMSNFPTLRAGALTVGDCSYKAPGKSEPKGSGQEEPKGSGQVFMIWQIHPTVLDELKAELEDDDS